MTYILTNGRLSGLFFGSDYGMTYGYDTFGQFETINAQVAGTGTQTYTYSYLPGSDFIQQLTSNLDLIFPESLRIIDNRIEH